MKRDLYLEWINNEVLEKGFQEPLWGRVIQECLGNQTEAKALYLEKRKRQLLEQNFVPPLYEEGEQLSRVPRRGPPPSDFIDRNPVLVRWMGFALSLSLILIGFRMIRRFGLK